MGVFEEVSRLQIEQPCDHGQDARGAGHPGDYLRLERPVERKPVKSEGQKAEATFEEMR